MTTTPRSLLVALAATSVLAAPLAAAAPASAAPVAVAPAPLAAAPAPVTALSVTSATAAREALGRRVATALRGSTATRVGVRVHVQGLGTVYTRSSTVALAPASTQKSFVNGAALLAMPSTTTFDTTARALPSTSGVAGRVDGPLWLVAGGDPYLPSSGLRELARKVRAAGVTEIAGGIRLDDRRYDSRRTAVGWKSTWMPSQSGPLSAMAVDRNRWRSDARFLADPALPAAVWFRNMLRQEGVTVAEPVLRAPVPAAAATVAVRPSAPLSLMAARTLKTSDNFAAELLLKEIGRRVRGAGSSASGVLAVRSVLAKRGVQFGTSTDGSGLSRYNRQTPAQQVALLRAMAAAPAGSTFRAALPVACKDGTLRTRMCRTWAAGRLAAKTGTLSGVRTLAGYTTTVSGRRVTFAVQLSGATDSARARAAIDRVGVVLSAARE